jgi:hypothetical protein
MDLSELMRQLMRRHDTYSPQSRFVSKFALMTRLKCCGQKLRDRSWHFNRSDSIGNSRGGTKNRALPGYQINLLPLSLFQLKDEPEGEGIRQLRKAPFWFESWIEIISRRVEGMWESRSDFRHFLRRLACACELVKEFVFGLLHAACGFGVTAGGGHVLERVHSETGSQVLSRLG